MGTFGNTWGNTFGSNGVLLKLLLQKFAFWSKGNADDYYASLENDSPYYSLTEKN